MTANEEASVTPEFKLALTAVIPFTDMEKSVAFYRDIVGFRLASDVVARFGVKEEPGRPLSHCKNPLFKTN